MNKEKQLFKNTAIVSIGKLCTQLITFFLLPLYTYALSTEEYGIVDLLNTLISLFIPIVILQIDQGVFRYLLDVRDKEEEKKKIISSTIFFTIIQSVIYLILFSFASQFIHNDYKYFLAINLVAIAFSTILLQISRGIGDNVRYAVGSFLTGLVTVILNVVLIIVFHLGAYGLLIASLCGNIICIIYILFAKKLYNYTKVKYFDKAILKYILKYSILLVPNMLSWWIVSASDRLIISTIIGVSANGIYSAANHFSGIFSTLNSVINMTWTESAALNIEAEDKEQFFSKIFKLYIQFFGALCLGVIAFMPFVFSILVNSKFNGAYYQIPILIIATFFNILTSFLGSIYIAKKLTNEIAKTSMISALINIIINISLIHFIGLYAASISTLVSYFIMFIYRLIDSKKYVKMQLNQKLLFSLMLMCVITIVAYYIKNIYLCVIVAVIITIYAIYINKNNAKFIINLVKNKLGGNFVHKQ